MKSLKTKVVVPVLTGTLIVSGYTGMKYKMLEKENEQLKQEMSDTKNNDENISYTTTVEEIKEINKKNTNLILYETDYSEYKSELKEDSFFGINAEINAKFKYDVVIDLSKAKVEKNGNKILVSINKSDIEMHDISIKNINISYDTNFFTQMRGGRIMEIESDLLTRAYEDVERLVNKDFTLNEDLFQLRLLEKIEKIYPYDVDVVFV